MTSIAKLYQSPKTILATKDLALIWQENNANNLKSKIAYYVKQGTLLRLTRGIFTKDKNYNPKELATTLYVPSYISFETVLREAGIIFQHHDTIFAAGPWSKTLMIDTHQITYRKLKKSLLYNPVGVSSQDKFSQATPERAFLDMLYLFPEYYFDNLRAINWERCSELARIYNNQQLLKRVNTYHKQNAE